LPIATLCFVELLSGRKVTETCTDRWLETQSDNFKKPWQHWGQELFSILENRKRRKLFVRKK